MITKPLKVRIPIAPPSQRHKSAKDYSRKDKDMELINYSRMINCQTNMPPEECDFITDTDYGDWKHGYGKGTMKYRRCLKCGLVEYSYFTGDNGKEIDIDAIHRNPKNLTEPFIVAGLPEIMVTKK